MALSGKRGHWLAFSRKRVRVDFGEIESIQEIASRKRWAKTTARRSMSGQRSQRCSESSPLLIVQELSVKATRYDLIVPNLFASETSAVPWPQSLTRAAMQLASCHTMPRISSCQEIQEFRRSVVGMQGEIAHAKLADFSGLVVLSSQFDVNVKNCRTPRIETRRFFLQLLA